MAKRKEDPPKAGSPAWMSTFSDLMNLLLCFFVLLFASSTIDAEKLEQVSASFAKDFIFEAGSTAIGEGRMVSSGVKQLSVLDNYVNSLGRNEKGSSANLSDVRENAEKPISAESTTADQLRDEKIEEQNSQQNSTAQSSSNQQAQSQESADQSSEDKALEEKVEETGYQQSSEMTEEIEKMIKSSQVQDLVSVDYNAQYVQLSLSGGVLFESGSADLREDAKPLVNKVGDILVKYRKRTIEIEGHTDNVPMSSGIYKDNNYLSSARAISVYEYLQANKNLVPANMKHSGYGDSKPKASNKTEKGRAKNRRVEIKIYNQISSQN